MHNVTFSRIQGGMESYGIISGPILILFFEGLFSGLSKDAFDQNCGVCSTSDEVFVIGNMISNHSWTHDTNNLQAGLPRFFVKDQCVLLRRVEAMISAEAAQASSYDLQSALQKYK